MKILLIDKIPEQIGYLAAILTKKGHRVESSSVIAGIFPKIQKEGYDVLFLDLTFPADSSLKLLADVREKNLELFSIGMAEAENDKLAGRALDQGAFDCLVKPITTGIIDTILRAVARKEQYEKVLNQLRDITDRILEAIPIGVEIINKDLVIAAWNKGMERIFGAKKDDVLGKRIFDLFPQFKQRIGERVFKTVLARGEPLTIDNYRHTTKSKKSMVLNLRYAPYKNSFGNIAGIIAIIEDVTQRAELEHELRRREWLRKGRLRRMARRN